MMSYLDICLSEQQLTVYAEDSSIQAQFRVSTAANGAGQQQGSECTPLGEHVIAECIGADEPLGSVFVGREPTGEVYSAELAAAEPTRDWILTRILWLAGAEPGINQGGTVDSKARYIYIHGTPETRPMGEPHSHGCITLHSEAMLKLFSLAHQGQRVVLRP